MLWTKPSTTLRIHYENGPNVNPRGLTPFTSEVAKAFFQTGIPSIGSTLATSYFACSAATDIVYQKSLRDTVKSEYYIPGDFGYIMNRSSYEYGGTNKELGQEGENLVYVGLGKFFGHIGTGENRDSSGKVTGGSVNPAAKFKSLSEWMNHVRKWGAAALWDGRTLVLNNIDYYELKNKMNFEDSAHFSWSVANSLYNKKLPNSK